jgi:thioredoxin reductase (NADPH)
VIIATGARCRRLNLPNEEQFTSAGIYYAATELEARLCRKSEVVVVGAGNSAGQAAMFLAGSAAQVHLVCRGSDIERSMSHYLVTRLEHAPNVRIHLNSEVASLRGDKRLEEATVEMRSGECRDVMTNAVFVMIGADPCTNWLRGTVDLDERGFVATGMAHGAGSEPGDALLSPFQTSVPGVFAVGDVRSGSVKRVASAVGEGSVVVQAVHRYLASRRPVAVLPPATV